MNDIDFSDRAAVWQKYLGRTPDDGLDGAAPEDRDAFVRRVMDGSADAAQNPNLELIRDAADCVVLNDGWPAGQPDAIIKNLVSLCNEKESKRSRFAKRTLHALMMSFAKRSQQPLMTHAQKVLVCCILDALKADKVRLEDARRRGESETANAYELATLLAGWYSAIYSVEQRAELIQTFRELIHLSPEEYGDPFIADLVYIYERLNLGSLEYAQE